MELNEKLISLRKKNKLTQAQVAEALDVSRQAISNWETGAVLPSTDNLIALSRLYQVPADHLLNDDSDLIPVPVEEKEVDKKEEAPPEPASGAGEGVPLHQAVSQPEGEAESGQGGKG